MHQLHHCGNCGKAYHAKINAVNCDCLAKTTITTADVIKRFYTKPKVAAVNDFEAIHAALVQLQKPNFTLERTPKGSDVKQTIEL